MVFKYLNILSLLFILMVTSCPTAEALNILSETKLPDASTMVDDLGRVSASKDCSDDCRIFKVRYVNLTDKFSVSDLVLKSEAQLHVAWLNEFFRTRKGYQLFEFRLEGYFDARMSVSHACPKLRQLGDLGAKASNGTIYEALGECYASSAKDARNIFSKNAINIYIYDAADEDGSTSTKDGRGGTAKGTKYGFLNSTDEWPYAFLDYKRFYSKSTYANHMAAQEHEVGHAFGLPHICVEGALNSTQSPIMSSSGPYGGDENLDCVYEAGDRTLGFSTSVESYHYGTIDEISIIRASAPDRATLLQSPTSSSPPRW